MIPELHDQLIQLGWLPDNGALSKFVRDYQFKGLDEAIRLYDDVLGPQLKTAVGAWELYGHLVGLGWNEADMSDVVRDYKGGGLDFAIETYGADHGEELRGNIEVWESKRGNTMTEINGTCRHCGSDALILASWEWPHCTSPACQAYDRTVKGVVKLNITLDNNPAPYTVWPETEACGTQQPPEKDSETIWEENARCDIIKRDPNFKKGDFVKHIAFTSRGLVVSGVVHEDGQIDIQWQQEGHMKGRRLGALPKFLRHMVSPQIPRTRIA